MHPDNTRMYLYRNFGTYSTYNLGGYDERVRSRGFCMRYK